MATNVNAIGIGIVQIGGALKIEIRARNIDWVRGFHLIKLRGRRCDGAGRIGTVTGSPPVGEEVSIFNRKSPE